MKKIILSIIVFAFIANVSAQFKINSSGKVGIGNDPNYAILRLYNATTPSFLLEGLSTRLEMGVATSNGSFSTFAQNGDIVYRPLGPKHGLLFSLPDIANDGNSYIKFGDEYNGGWFSIYNNKKMIIDGNVGIGKTPTYGMLDVIGSIYSGGSLVLTSDERLKSEIKPLFDEKEKLYQLQGKSYKKTTPPSNIKEVRYTEDGIELPVREREIIELKEYGYLAQELKNVFPELVTQDADGYYGVNYIGLIPVIVEAIKDQKLLIEKQQRQIEELKDAVFSGMLRSGAQAESVTGVSKVNFDTAVLYQNAPNPFSELTVIRYSLPESSKNAEIYFFNMQGSVIKKILATRSGMVEIKGSDLQAGMYLYSLIVDGKEVDTKRMILTK